MSRSRYSQRQDDPPSKPPILMTQSLRANSLPKSMQRANSFHQEMGTVQEKTECREASEGVTYRTSDDYYLDEDELILPLYPAETAVLQKSPRKSPHKLEALDRLVISTTHNVSDKLCQAASKIIRQAAKQLPEEDEELALNIETITYLLEDTHMASSYRTETSVELAG